MKTTYLGCALFSMILLSPPMCPALEYFPTETGPIFTYQDDWVAIHEFAPGIIGREHHNGYLNTQTEIYDIDEGGDVWLRGTYSYCESSPCFRDYMFNPSILFLDYPLETGKTWYSAVYEHLDSPDELNWIGIMGTVVGERTVAVPAGEFDVVVVTLEFTCVQSPGRNHTEELWLHRQLGPINGLASWTGVVGSASTCWGNAKALFR